MDEAASGLVDFALKLGSLDNVSVVLLRFSSRPFQVRAPAPVGGKGFVASKSFSVTPCYALLKGSRVLKNSCEVFHQGLVRVTNVG